jgi:putative acetyltransferase
MTFSIREDDLTSAVILALLKAHLDEMRACSPACSVHAMSAKRLREPDVTFWSIWSGDELAGCGALKEIDRTHGEIKSMRAAPAWRGRGAGSAMLRHIVAEARRRGYARLSLETGRAPVFEPAIALYARHGFTECGAFAGYRDDDPFSLFMTCTL